MERLRVDDILSLIPDLDELRPLRDGVMATSVPDPARRWTAAGELETVGQRLVQGRRVEEELDGYVDGIADHLRSVFQGVASAIRSLEKGDRLAAAAALLDVASAEEEAGRHGRAEKFAMAAYETARGERSREVTTHALRRAGRAARSLGKIELAAERYTAAYQIARDGNDTEHAIVAAIGRGNVAVDRGLWEDARSWYETAWDALEEVGTSRSERWHVCLDLSITTRQLGDTDASREWLERAQAEATKVGDAGATATIRNGWGRLYHVLGRLEEAEAVYREALAAAKGAKARVTIAVNLGEVLADQDRLLDAADQARSAEVLALRTRVVTKLPEVYRLLGRFAAARGLMDALVFFERALVIGADRELPDFERAQTLEAYGNADAADPAGAAARLEEAAQIYDTLGIDHMRDRATASLRALESDGKGPEGASG